MSDPLDSWQSLNAAVMDLSEEELKRLLRREAKRRPPRKQHLNRIYCRFSRLRRDRECAELGLPAREGAR